jgi:hypothetical protein
LSERRGWLRTIPPSGNITNFFPLVIVNSAAKAGNIWDDLDQLEKLPVFELANLEIPQID